MIQKPTDRDTTIDEIHLVREHIHDTFGGDIQAMLEDAQKRQNASGRPIWNAKRTGENGETADGSCQ